MSGALRIWTRTYRAEGPAAVRDRLLDRWNDTRSQIHGPAAQHRTWPAVPMLNVIGVEMAARGGGVPLQLRARLRCESAERPIALLARRLRGGFHLECWNGGRSTGRFFSGSRWDGDPLQDERGWGALVQEAADSVGARAVHIENLAGLSLVSLHELSRGTLPLVVSLHDFGAFCRRPHLWESSGAFCHYSTDANRCRRCLTASTDSFAIDQARHRKLGAQILGRAAALIFPSHFLRTRLAELMPWGGAPISEVISPGLDVSADAPQSIRRSNEVAFIGGGADHKGGARLPVLARRLATSGVAVTVYGGNGHEHLLQLRQIPGVRVRGYFLAGTLPTLLVRQRAAVALLLPGVPESFSLSLSEAWTAGVPVVAPSQGALSERLSQGGGVLLRADPSDDELLGAIDRLRHLPIDALPPPPTAADAARGHIELYRRCGVLSVP